MAATLDLTDTKADRAAVVFPSGKQYELRSPDELTLGELQSVITQTKQLESGGEDALGGVKDLLNHIVVDAPADEIDTLTKAHIMRMMDFFTESAEADDQTTSEPSRAHKGSTAGQSKSG